GDRNVKGPVYIQPGQADDAITVALGYGRKGSETTAHVGFNAGLLRTSDAPWFARGVAVSPKISSGYRFGITQDHWSMEDREPAMVTTIEDLEKKSSEFNKRIEDRRGELEVIV